MGADSNWLDGMPAYYDRCLGPTLFAPFARYLARLAADRSPDMILELAAGSGLLTAELARESAAARITATDLNEAMVSWAEQHVSGPTWLTADAQALRFPDASFDLIVCQFGVMFFPDKPRAFEQAARVLRPRGTYLFSVWDAVETSPLTAMLVAALADVLPDDPPDFVARVPHGYHDPDRIRLDVEAGGLQIETLDRVVLRGNSPSAATLAQGFCLGSPLRFALQERGDVVTLTEAVAERMTARLGAGPIEGQIAAFVVSARHPG